MKQLSIEMPQVTSCSKANCAYNVASACRARAITVGDAAHPACDTYFPSTEHAKALQTAGVGACKVTDCVHNRDFACCAEDVEVGGHRDHADCLTFARQR